MSSSTIATTSREYASRPPDERFPSIDAMIANAEDERARSQERTYQLGALRFQAVARQQTCAGHVMSR